MTNDKEKAAVTEAEYRTLAAETAARAAEEGPVPVDPDVAEAMGAFEEDALSEEEALDSLFDAPSLDDLWNGRKDDE